VSHAAVATAGLCLWIAFMVTAAPVLGWIDVALTGLIVGLGMATLLASSPEGGAVVAAAAGPAPDMQRPGSRPPVLTIALHGALATVTIAFVLTAVIGVG
jgi:hypothetical protein